MKSLLPILTFLLFFSGISPSLVPPQEFRFALLIGNADYEGAARLQNPINDIRRLSPLFKKYGFEVTQIENANQEAMGKAIDDFSRKISQARQKYSQAQITTLFYYSGHGLSHAGRNYLIPIKTEIPNPESLQYRAKSLEEITSLFSSSDVRLLFFDACRNELPTRSWWRGLPSIDENQGLSSPKIEEPTPRQNSDLNGTFIGYATALGKRALDGNISISPYAEAFEKELTNNPSLQLSDLLTNIGLHVGKTTNYAQSPWQSSTRTVGRFRFDNINNEVKQQIENPWESFKYVNARVDALGRVITLPLPYDTIGAVYSEGLAKVKQRSWVSGGWVSNSDEKYGFIDKIGQPIIPFWYDYAEDFKNGIAYVVKDNQKFYINKKNECVKGDCPQGIMWKN